MELIEQSIAACYFFILFGQCALEGQKPLCRRWEFHLSGVGIQRSTDLGTYRLLIARQRTLESAEQGPVGRERHGLETSKYRRQGACQDALRDYHNLDYLAVPGLFQGESQ